MKGKKAISAFMLISIFKFVIGAIVTVLLLTAVWTFFGPKEKAEVSTMKSIDDVILKLNMIEEGQSLIAYGYVDKEAAIVGFSSDILKVGEANRPKQCGARSNSCICAFKGLKYEKVLECKGFQSSKISMIQKKGGGDFKIDWASFEFRSGGAFTLTMTLLPDKILSIEQDLTATKPEVVLA